METINEYLEKFEKSFTFEASLEQIQGYFKSIFQEYLETLPEKRLIKPEIEVFWKYATDNKITVNVPVDERYRLKIYDDTVIAEGDEDNYFVPFAVLPPLLLDIIKDDMYSYEVNYALSTKKYGKMLYATSHKNDYSSHMKTIYGESKFEEFTFQFDLGATLYHVGLKLCPELYPYKHFASYKQDIKYKQGDTINDTVFVVTMIYYGK